MPTKNPRVMVTLSPEDHELIRKVAALQETSMSALLAEYVVMSRPMLEHIVSIAEELERMDVHRRETHRAAVDGVIEKVDALRDMVEGQLPLFADRLDIITDQLRGSDNDQAEDVAPDPQPTNRGVRSQQVSTVQVQEGGRR